MMFMVWHSLREPVTNIMGLSQMLKRKSFPEHEKITILNYIDESANRLDSLTKELANFINELDKRQKEET
jgi:signal transduction histidine kinase